MTLKEECKNVIEELIQVAKLEKGSVLVVGYHKFKCYKKLKNFTKE